MRVIAGSAKRTVLEIAEGSSTRPFLELARGALFNSLGGRVENALALDLYAGSGALGIEALSRGAKRCVFVERDAKAFAALKRNVDKCRMAEQAVLTRSDVGAFLAADTGRYDLVFVDPPFPDLPRWRPGGGAETAMRDAARLLARNGVLMFRLEDRKIDAPEWPDLEPVMDRRYGRSRVCIYEKGEAARTGGDA